MRGFLTLSDITPFAASLTKPFDEERCTRCGKCLAECPVMGLPHEEAVAEIERLIKGERTRRALEDCQSCFSCNLYCPEGANPAGLVLQRWNEQYRRDGLKSRGEYFMTLHPHYPNFRSYVLDRMPEASKDVLRRWADASPLKGDTLTYPGCNVITFPELTQTNLLDGLEIRGRLEYCCGETLFRTGYVDELRGVAARLDKWFNALHPQHLVVLCTAGTNVIKNVLPRYGLTYKFKSVKSYIQYIWEKMERGEIHIKQDVKLKVSIQDSCYAKMFGDEYMNLPRKILERIGVQVVETDAVRENMRCCGIGGGFSVDSAYHPLKIQKSVSRNVKAFKRLGVDAICVYCAGCLQMLGAGQKLMLGRPMRVVHILELLREAAGEPPIPEKVKDDRFKAFVNGVLRHQFPKLLSKKTFRVGDIPEDPPAYGKAF
ncbi:MAG: (Fe-S)-binding protein [Candidatus Lokiarchaeota archaeon]|nr:(Fe-S)-binding protein [Candidatus Lokiarchaeota archaeon]